MEFTAREMHIKSLNSRSLDKLKDIIKQSIEDNAKLGLFSANFSSEIYSEELGEWLAMNGFIINKDIYNFQVSWGSIQEILSDYNVSIHDIYTIKRTIKGAYNTTAKVLEIADLMKLAGFSNICVTITNDTFSIEMERK